MPWAENKGFYILILHMEKETTITIGKLGTTPFPPGTYCYVGRAKTCLRQRIARHSRKTKSLRWHIDHLLPHVEIRSVFLLPLDSTTECALARQLMGKGGTPYPTRFGASDCRCPGHLIYLPTHHSRQILSNLTKATTPSRLTGNLPRYKQN